MDYISRAGDVINTHPDDFEHKFEELLHAYAATSPQFVNEGVYCYISEVDAHGTIIIIFIFLFFYQNEIKAKKKYLWRGNFLFFIS